MGLFFNGFVLDTVWRKCIISHARHIREFMHNISTGVLLVRVLSLQNLALLFYSVLLTYGSGLVNKQCILRVNEVCISSALDLSYFGCKIV